MTFIVSGSPEQKGTRANGFNSFSSREFRNDDNRTGFRGGNWRENLEVVIAMVMGMVKVMVGIMVRLIEVILEIKAEFWK